MESKSFLATKRGKAIMNKIVCWGASVVIFGALFKIEHYPGSGVALISGLGTESLIFLLYGFIPEHEEVDWALVYPELAGMHEEGEGHPDEIEGAEDDKKGTVTEQLDNLLEEAKIGPELIESLGQGLKSLSDTTAKMSDITDASVATNDYVNNIKSASKNMGDLSENSSKAAETLEGVANSDPGSATKEYVNKVQALSQSMGDLSNSSDKASETLKTLSVSSSSAYVDQMEKMAENAAALNAVYEMQLQTSNEQIKVSGRLYESVSKLVENVSESVEDTRRYKTEMTQLVQHLESLNTVYGGMLTAMNMKR